MGWTRTDWSGLLNSGSLSIWHDTWAALRERALAVEPGGESTPPVEPAVGKNFGSMAFIHDWQERIESLCGFFAVSHDSGAPLGAGYYDGAASIPTYTLASLFSAAGLATNDWRRYTAHPGKGGRYWPARPRPATSSALGCSRTSRRS